jgi:hypothetical protein
VWDRSVADSTALRAPAYDRLEEIVEISTAAGFAVARLGRRAATIAGC